MKFFSTFQNYRVILKPGIPGNRALGTQPTPAISARFEGGVVEIPDDNKEMITMMKNHPAFGKDFIAENQEVSNDPYEYKRRDTEPQHTVSEVKYGHVEGTQNAGKSMSPDRQAAFKKAVRAEALKIVQEMLSKSEETPAEATEESPVNASSELPKVVNDRITAPEPIEDDLDDGVVAEESTDANNIPSEDVVSEKVSEAIDAIIPQNKKEEKKDTEEPKPETENPKPKTTKKSTKPASKNAKK